MKSKSLEEISWKEGKWRDSKDSEVTPLPIGPSQVVSSVVYVKSIEDPEYVKFKEAQGYKVPESSIHSVDANDEQLRDHMREKIIELIKLNPEEKEYAKINVYSRGKYGSAIHSRDGTIVQFYKV